MADKKNQKPKQDSKKPAQAKEPVTEVQIVKPRVVGQRMDAAKAKDNGLDPFVYGKPAKAEK